MTTKYRVGDKVRIINEQGGHRFELGTIVTITKINGDYNYLATDQKGNDWYVWDSEIESVTGFIVGKTYTTRGGGEFMCVHIREDGSAIFDDGDSVFANYPDGINTYGWDAYDIVLPIEKTCKGRYYDYVTKEWHKFKIDFQIVNDNPDWKNAKVTGYE